MDNSDTFYNEKIEKQANDILDKFKTECAAYYRRIQSIRILTPKENTKLIEALKNIETKLQNSMDISLNMLMQDEKDSSHHVIDYGDDFKQKKPYDKREAKIDKRDQKISELSSSITSDKAANQGLTKEEYHNIKKIQKLRKSKGKLYQKQLKITDKGLKSAIENYKEKQGLDFKLYNSIIKGDRKNINLRYDENQLKSKQADYNEMIIKSNSPAIARDYYRISRRVSKLEKKQGKIYGNMSDSIVKGANPKNIKKMKNKASNAPSVENALENSEGKGR